MIGTLHVRVFSKHIAGETFPDHTTREHELTVIEALWTGIVPEEVT